MTAPVRPPRQEGLQGLAPELARIVEAMARVQEERDHRAAIDPEVAFSSAHTRYPTIMRRLAE